MPEFADSKKLFGFLDPKVSNTLVCLTRLNIVYSKRYLEKKKRDFHLIQTGGSPFASSCDFCYKCVCFGNRSIAVTYTTAMSTGTSGYIWNKIPSRNSIQSNGTSHFE